MAASFVAHLPGHVMSSQPICGLQLWHSQLFACACIALVPAGTGLNPEKHLLPIECVTGLLSIGTAAIVAAQQRAAQFSSCIVPSRADAMCSSLSKRHFQQPSAIKHQPSSGLNLGMTISHGSYWFPGLAGTGVSLLQLSNRCINEWRLGRVAQAGVTVRAACMA